MKAIMCPEYGPPDVLRVEEIGKPVPKDNEILVKIYAVPVNFGDIIARNFRNITPREFSMPLPLWLVSRMVFGSRKPNKKILGSEFAGEVEAVGKAVKKFKKGDQVFGYRGMNLGANAEYICVPEKGMTAIKPKKMTYEEASAVPYGAITALNLLRKVNIRKGQKVLVNGASGGIGSYAVQLAKYYGAEVTGVCGTPRLGLVKSLGADKVIDYTQDDFTKNGETYDLIFDILNKSSFSHCKNSLKPNGIYLLASFKTKQLLQMLWTKIIGGKRVKCALSVEKPDDLVFIKDLVEAGKLKTVVDKDFPMEQAAEAHRYYESGAKKGSVILTFNRNKKK